MTATYFRKPVSTVLAPKGFQVTRVIAAEAPEDIAVGAHATWPGNYRHVSPPAQPITGRCWSCGAPQCPFPPLCRDCGWALYGPELFGVSVAQARAR